MSRPRSIPFLALLLFATSVLAQAPRDTTARVAGKAMSARSGAPLPGVMVALPQAKAFVVSDSAGTFVLAGLPAVTQPLRVLYRGDVFDERSVTLRPGKTLRLEVLLDVEAEELAPVVVEARSIRAAHSLAGFYDRRRFGFGRFYTFDDLERRGSASLRALLSESGIQVRCWSLSCVALSNRSAHPCVMPVYRDGMPFPIDDLDLLRVDELAAVEVYRSGFEVPGEFQNRFGGRCGAILIWSRY